MNSLAIKIIASDHVPIGTFYMLNGHIIVMHWTQVPLTEEQYSRWERETPEEHGARIVAEVLEHHGATL